MALIELYFVVADHLQVKDQEEIIEGDFVKIDAVTGKLVLCDTAGERPYGVAGDTKSVATSGMPSMNEANLSNGDDMLGTPNPRGFVNRVSDSFDETKASGRLTVYHSGGKFATNRYVVAGAAFAPGVPLYVTNDGRLTTVDGGVKFIVAICVKAPSAYPSGVPGTDVDGSMSLGDYLEYKLVI